LEPGGTVLHFGKKAGGMGERDRGSVVKKKSSGSKEQSLRGEPRELWKKPEGTSLTHYF